jgi:hypothetical protein
MFVVLRNPMYRLVSLGVSIAIFLVIYFAVIKPNQNTANNALTQGTQQLKQAVNQAAKSGGVPASATNLVNCIAAAGSDTGALQACAAKFKK